MAVQLLFLTACSPVTFLTAILGLLILLVVLVPGKQDDEGEQLGSETSEDSWEDLNDLEDHQWDVNRKYPSQTNAVKRNSNGTIPDADSEGKREALAASAHGGSRELAPAKSDCQKVSVPFFRSVAPVFVSPLLATWRLPLCPDDLYQQLLSYRLSPRALYRCGYPRPCPGKPGRAVWMMQGGAANSTRKTCCRCGKTFYITPDGEYYSCTVCHFHTGWRIGRIFSCCRRSVDELGCQRSQYHVCAQGLRKRRDMPAGGFVRTRARYGVTGGVFALDCEMCFTIRGLEVVKVSVVGWNGVTVYDSYVKPGSPVLDYNTPFSGVTAETLRNVRTTLQDVQSVLLRLFTASTILVGHGLENDLRVLKLLHDSVVDTSIVFPHHRGLPFRRSLRSLVAAYLNREVQQGPRGHDSVEDARACMELVLWKAARDHHQQRTGWAGGAGRGLAPPYN
ncbi:exonuclease GOR-like [Haemaphysalis longicornis]